MIPSFPASPVPLTLMSVHVLLTLIIIILFHSADLVSTSILNVSGAPTGNQALRPCRPHASTVFALISGSDSRHVWIETVDALFIFNSLTNKHTCHLRPVMVD